MNNIEQRKLELLSKLQQLQKDNPRCVWLQATVDMNNLTDLKASSDDRKGK